MLSWSHAHAVMVACPYMHMRMRKETELQYKNVLPWFQPCWFCYWRSIAQAFVWTCVKCIQSCSLVLEQSCLFHHNTQASGDVGMRSCWRPHAVMAACANTHLHMRRPQLAIWTYPALNSLVHCARSFWICLKYIQSPWLILWQSCLLYADTLAHAYACCHGGTRICA